MLNPLKFNPEVKMTHWCGPAAVAILTDTFIEQTTSRAAQLTSQRYEDVSSLLVDDVRLMLREAGKSTKDMKVFERYSSTHKFGPKVFKFFRENFSPFPILCATKSHFFVYHMGYCIDNQVKKPTPLDLFKYRTAHIHAAYEVF